MMPSSAENSSAKLTVFAGEPSLRTSRWGTLSPTLTSAAGVEWKDLVALTVEAMPERAARATGRRDALNAIVRGCQYGQVGCLLDCLLARLSAGGWVSGHEAEVSGVK